MSNRIGIFVAATIDRSLRIYSCYVSPNCSTADYEQFLTRLETSLMRHRYDNVDLIVAGDFNARSAYWGDWITDSRGNALCELADAMSLLVANIGREPTFHGRGEGSIIDVTLVSDKTIGSIRDWSVRSEVENLSDHHHLTYTYGNSGPTRSGNSQQTGWIVNKIDEDLFATGMCLAEWIDETCSAKELLTNPSEAAADKTRHNSV